MLLAITIFVVMLLEISADADFNTSNLDRFITKIDARSCALSTITTIADWNYRTNMTDANSKKMDEINKHRTEFFDKVKEAVKAIPWESYKDTNETLYRWFMVASGKVEGGLSEDLQHETMNQVELQNAFMNAKMCEFGKNETECKLPFEPDVTTIMTNSRDPEELKHYWKEFRDQIGGKAFNLYPDFIKSKNENAVQGGFTDAAEQVIGAHQSNTTEKDFERIMEEIKPLYQQLHAYVRKKLIKYYNSVTIKDKGPIPAHILGDMYAQEWISLFSIVKPYANFTNVTELLIAKKYNPMDMFIAAEKFYVSLGFEKMTPHFWHYSMIEKPLDRKVECHAFAIPFNDGKDYRIRMCTKVMDKDFQVVHHEMGHIQYFMHYAKQLCAFRYGANSAFHEAIGDALSLSVFRPEYLKEVGLLDEVPEENTEQDITFLMQIALEFFVNIPYAYIIDLWRLAVYRGEITMENYNTKYWEMRWKYQGVCPPVKRNESDMDMLAKYHVSNDVDYTRYYAARILQFQIYKGLCDAAGHDKELFKCNLYGQKKAGKLFGEFMSLGMSQPWQKSLSMLTGSRYSDLNSAAILDYFDPLFKWLQQENANDTVGWDDSDDPMQCP